MAELYQQFDKKNEYFDKHSGLSEIDYKAALKRSTTLYIGNLSHLTQEGQLLDLFGRCGEVKNVIMGLTRDTKRPCGFCFVEYETRYSAELAVDCLNRVKLDDKQIRVDWDYGFKEGR